MRLLAEIVALCWLQVCAAPTPRQYEGDRSDLARQNLPQSGQLEFFMDSSSDCSPVVRDTGDRSIVVHGRGAIQSGASPLTCEITLRVDNPLHPRKYKIGLQEMDIRDCNIQFYIYDGTKSHSLLGRYGCPQNSGTNHDRVLWTSGNVVTFYISRSSREQTLYSIRIYVDSIAGNTDWDEEFPENPDYNRFFKFEQTWVILIIGLGYAFVTLICGLLLLICCCCIRRETDKWQLSQFGLTRSTDLGPTRLDSSYDRLCPEPNRPIEMKDMSSTNRENRINNSLQRKPLRVNSREELQDENRNGRDIQRNLKKRRQGTNDNREQGSQVQREILIPRQSKRRIQKNPKDDLSSSEEGEVSSDEDVKKVPSDTDSNIKDSDNLDTDTDEEAQSEKSDLVFEKHEQENADMAQNLYAKPKKVPVAQKPKKGEQGRAQRDDSLWQTGTAKGSVQPTEVRSGKSVNAQLAEREPDGKTQDHPQQNQPSDIHNPMNGESLIQPHPLAANQLPDRPTYRPSGRTYQTPENRPLHRGHPLYHNPSHPETLQAGVAALGQPEPRGQNPYPGMAPPPYQLTTHYPRYTPRPPVASQPPVFSYLVNRGYQPVARDGPPTGSYEPVPPSGELHSADIDSGIEVMRR